MAEETDFATLMDVERNTITEVHSQVVEIIAGRGDSSTITELEDAGAVVTDMLEEAHIVASETAGDTSPSDSDAQESENKHALGNDMNTIKPDFDADVIVPEAKADVGKPFTEADGSAIDTGGSHEVLTPSDPDAQTETPAEDPVETEAVNDASNTTDEPVPDTKGLGHGATSGFSNETNTAITTLDVSASEADRSVRETLSVDQEEKKTDEESSLSESQTQQSSEDKSEEALEETSGPEPVTSATTEKLQVEVFVPERALAVPLTPYKEECQENGAALVEPELSLQDTEAAFVAPEEENSEEPDSSENEELLNEIQDENGVESGDETQQKNGLQSPVASVQASGEIPSSGKKPDINRHSYSKYNTVSYRKIRKGNTKQRIDEFESMMHI
ncbi:ERMIN protein, partial [Atractosteus spatula]|nr:ERMIN protein [Atractosteus spatula]